MVTAGAELNPGAIVDRRYRIQCVLGRGGFGRTYLAADEQRFNELCVLKEFVPHAEADSLVAQKLRELFQREAETLHQLDHPQIPQFFAGFEVEDRLFIAQEYIDGKTYWRLLQERQRQGYHFSQSEILIWLKDLLNLLDYLHRQNIVHRDISPDNIMLKRGTQSPVLIDFGVVKQIIPHLHLVNPNDPDGLIQASVSVGKFGYAPYEQIRMGQCSPRSDLYALAVTAVVLLTGKPPNLLMDAKSLEWQWQRHLRLDPQLAQILSQMMADKPQDRYASAAAVLQALSPLEPLIMPTILRRPIAVRSARSARHKSSTQLFAPASITAGEISLVATAADLVDQVLASSDQPETGLESNLEVMATAPDSPTQIEAALVPMRSQALSPPSSIHSMQPMQQTRTKDQLGNAPAQFSLRRVLAMSALAILPLGGVAVGIRSPHMASLCGVLSNCAADAAGQSRYQQAIEQADSAGLLLQQARDLTGLQQARQKLADSIAQLNAAGNFRSYAAAQLVLPRYRTTLAKLDETLETQARATQLLNRAEAEAQKATEQTKLAKTYSHYQAAQLQWRRSLATLAAVPKETFASTGAAARLQEYQARLDAVNLKLTAMTPKAPKAPKATVAASPVGASGAVSAAPVGIPASTRPLPMFSPAKLASNAPAQSAAAPRPTAVRQAGRPPQPARRSASAPAIPTPVLATSPTARMPATSPLQVDRQWVAGSVITSATQTLNNVSIWIDGTRTEADGKFVANLWIQNRSGRGFGFGPLYAESKDVNGQIYRSRVLFTSNMGRMLEPGKGLSGQIYLLEHPGLDKSRLTLVVQESTSGERSFRIPF